MLKIVIHSTILTGVVFTSVPATGTDFLIFYLLMQILICIHIVKKHVSLSIIFRNIMILFFLLKNSIITFLFQLNVVDNLIIYDLVIKNKSYFQSYSYYYKEEPSFLKKWIHTIHLYIRAPFTPLFWIISCIITFLMIHYHIYNLSFAESNGVWGQVQNFFQHIINGLTFRYDIHSLPSILGILTISSGITYGFSKIWFYYKKNKKTKNEYEDEVSETPTNSSVSSEASEASEARGSRFLNLYNWFDWFTPYAEVQADKNYFFSKKHYLQQEEVVQKHKELVQINKRYLNEKNHLFKTMTDTSDEGVFKHGLNYPLELSRFSLLGPNEEIRNLKDYLICVHQHHNRYFTPALRALVRLDRKAKLWDENIQKSGCIPVYPPTTAFTTTPTGLQLPKGYRVIYEPGSFAKSYLQPTAVDNMSLRKEITPLIEEQLTVLDAVYARHIDACLSGYLHAYDRQPPREDFQKLLKYFIRNGSLSDQFRYAVEKDDFYKNQTNFEITGVPFEKWKRLYLNRGVAEEFPSLLNTKFKLDREKNLKKIQSKSWEELNVPDAPDYCPESLMAKHYPVSTPTIRDLHQNPAPHDNVVPIEQVSELFNNIEEII